MNLTVGKSEDIILIYNNMYKDSSYFLKRKYEKFNFKIYSFVN